MRRYRTDRLEGAANIEMAVPFVEFGLGLSGTGALATLRQQRYSHAATEDASEFQRLIVATGSQSPRMERYRHQGLRQRPVPALGIGLYRVSEQFTEEPDQVQLRSEFDPGDQPGQWVLVAKGGEAALEGW